MMYSILSAKTSPSCPKKTKISFSYINDFFYSLYLTLKTKNIHEKLLLKFMKKLILYPNCQMRIQNKRIKKT